VPGVDTACKNKYQDTPESKDGRYVLGTKGALNYDLDASGP
jgi:hypothetical protein